MKGKINWKQIATALFVALVVIPLVSVGVYFGWDAYDAYRDRQLSVTVTGPVRVWEHPDLDLHAGARVIAVLEAGARVEVLRTQAGSDWASVRVRLADGREGYIDGFGPGRSNYVLRGADRP